MSNCSANAKTTNPDPVRRVIYPGIRGRRPILRVGSMNITPLFASDCKDDNAGFAVPLPKSSLPGLPEVQSPCRPVTGRTAENSPAQELSERATYKVSKMNWINRARLKSELLAGTFLNLGSATAVEIAASAGFDWVLIDMEHGSGAASDLRGQLLAIRGSEAIPIVRIPSIDADMVKFVMDSGAAGVMFPYVPDAAEAARAVSFMKYPPHGTRGVAQVIRATNYGRSWKKYLEEANDHSLAVIQIETPEAADSAEEIAAVGGVDVLFVGPMDLSVNMGHPGDFTPSGFVKYLKRVVDACEKMGKTAGILSRPELVEQHRSLGFRFIALGSDSGAIVQGMQQNVAVLRKHA